MESAADSFPKKKDKNNSNFPAARKFEKTNFVRLDAMDHVIFGTSFWFANFHEFQCSLHLIVPPSMTRRENMKIYK